MRVLVTGGSGYVGSAVVRALVGHGHKVTGVTRSPDAQKKLAALNAHARPGTLEQPASLARAAEGHEALVHAAIGKPELDRPAILALIEAAKQSGEPRIVVYTSGIWTLGTPGGPEDAELHTPAISRVRAETERAVLAAGDERVVTAVIRPGMVYGGAHGVPEFLCRVIGDGSAPAYIDAGKNRWTPVHRDDVGELYRLVIEKRAGGVFHAVEPEAVATAELARMLHEAGAPAPQSVTRAQAEAKLGAPLAEALALDIVGVARRSWDLGWHPQGRFAVQAKQTWKEFKGEQ